MLIIILRETNERIKKNEMHKFQSIKRKIELVKIWKEKNISTENVK